MKHLMIDIETLSNEPNAMILSIGAAFFCPQLGVTATFHEYIDVEDSIRFNRHIAPSTVLWWMGQSDAARQTMIDNQKQSKSLRSVLQRFWEFINEYSFWEELQVWGNGSDFDNVILASSYKALGLSVPWKFYNNRCYRTLKNRHTDIKMNRKGIHHDALADAISQAEHAIEIFRQHPVTGGVPL